jgi:endonuclease/exonuclease/phosphatase family metal-dependent hydrolase
MKIFFSLVIILFSFYSNTSAQSPDSLRIISYNIHHANPPAKPGLIDIQAFIDVFKKYQADVIALQEVDVDTKRSGNINEAKMIADGLGMYFFFGKAIDYDGGYYGVALLSRFPLKDTQYIQLPADTTSKGEQRILAVATITLQSGRSVTVACTHLDHRKDPKSRELQVAAISAFAKKNPGPFVIAGDLNAEPESGVIKMFGETFQKSCDACPLTFPAIFPDRTIDYVGFKKAKGIKVVSHQALPESYASDHLPTRVVIRFDK